MNNTKKFGVLRFFIYPDKAEKAFVGVCIDLGIIEVNENLENLKKDLEEAAQGYLEAVSKNDFDDSLLNQKPPKKYLDLYQTYLSGLQQNLKTNHLPWYASAFKSRLPSSLADAQVFTKDICLAIG